MSTPTPAPWPLVTVRLHDDGSAEVDHLGTTHTLQAADLELVRDQVRQWVVTRVAGPAGRPIAVTVTEPAGRFHITIDQHGHSAPSSHGVDRLTGEPGSPRPRTGLVLGVVAGGVLLAGAIAARTLLGTGSDDPTATPPPAQTEMAAATTAPPAASSTAATSAEPTQAPAIIYLEPEPSTSAPTNSDAASGPANDAWPPLEPESVEAVATAWVDGLNEARASGDLDALAAVTAPGCESCVDVMVTYGESAGGRLNAVITRSSVETDDQSPVGFVDVLVTDATSATLLGTWRLTLIPGPERAWYVTDVLPAGRP